MTDWGLSIPMRDGEKRAVFPDHPSLRLAVQWLGVLDGEPQEPTKDIVDIGACCGAFSLAALRLFPNAVITAFEPSPQAWPYLVENLADAADLMQKAVSDHEGKTYLTEGRIGTQRVSWRGTEVSSVKLDDVVFRADLVKIDTEGHEKEVLLGARQLLSENKPAVIVEIIDQDPLNEVRSLLKILGYKMRARLTKRDYLYT